MAAATVQAPPAAFQPASEQIKPQLRSNYGDALDSEAIGWMKPTAGNTHISEMRRRFDADGYMLVKSLLPRDEVLNVREEYFNHLKSTGILQPGTSSRDGIFNNDGATAEHVGIGSPIASSSSQILNEKLVLAHANPQYLQFLSHPPFRAFIRDFMGWEDDVLLERTMIRHAVPRGLSTGIHYDQIYLRGGDPGDEFLTAWVPLGDISASGGGLMYLSDSTALGRAYEADFMARAKDMPYEERVSAFNANMTRTGALSQDAREFYDETVKGKESTSHRWLIANYEAGDIVFHNPYMIHAAAMNQDAQGRIRLSTDLRFYKSGAGLDKRWQKPWNPEDGL